LTLEPGEHDLLGVLNDRIADGRDVSWIWDADFELLAQRVARITCSGTRAADLATRMKYAGVPPERIRVEPGLEAALDRALAGVGAGTGRVSLALAPRGHAITALERDPELAAALRERAGAPAAALPGAGSGQITVVEGDARTLGELDDPGLPAEARFALCIVA